MSLIIFCIILIYSWLTILAKSQYLAKGQTLTFCVDSTLPSSGTYTASIVTNSDQDWQLISSVSMNGQTNSNGWGCNAGDTISVELYNQVAGTKPEIVITSGSDYVRISTVSVSYGSTTITTTFGSCSSSSTDTTTTTKKPTPAPTNNNNNNNNNTPDPTPASTSDSESSGSGTSLPATISTAGGTISFSVTTTSQGMYLAKVTISNGQSKLIKATLDGQDSSNSAVSAGYTYDLYISNVGTGDTSLIITCTDCSSSSSVTISNVVLYLQSDQQNPLTLGTGSGSVTTPKPTPSPTTDSGSATTPKPSPSPTTSNGNSPTAKPTPSPTDATSTADCDSLSYVSATPRWTGAEPSDDSYGTQLARSGPVKLCDNRKCEGDALSEFRKKRGGIDPSCETGLLSNPYREDGTSLNRGAYMPDGFTGHVPVFSEGNWWPYVGDDQPLPPHDDLNCDTGAYYQNGERVLTSNEPLFVAGETRSYFVNKTPYSIVQTSGMYPGNEMPGQVMTMIYYDSTQSVRVPVPIPPYDWYNQYGTGTVPEMYVSVAGLDPIDAIGWHYSCSPACTTPGDLGVPQFAYNFASRVAYFSNKYWISAGFNKVEGWDPYVAGDPMYGVAIYHVADGTTDYELHGIMDIYTSGNNGPWEVTSGTQDIWCTSAHVPQQTPQGGYSCYINIEKDTGDIIYELITHSEAQSLISQAKNGDFGSGQFATNTYTVSAWSSPTSPPSDFVAIEGEDTSSGTTPTTSSSSGPTTKQPTSKPTPSPSTSSSSSVDCSFSSTASSTPPYTGSEETGFDTAPRMKRGGPVLRCDSWKCTDDALINFRTNRGDIKPSCVDGLLSNPYRTDGLALNDGYKVFDTFTGHMPVFTEGNMWPNIGSSQPQPPHSDYYCDWGPYYIDAEIVGPPSDEPWLVEGESGVYVINRTPYSILLTAGSYPGNEQPGQVMTMVYYDETCSSMSAGQDFDSCTQIVMPVPPYEWFPDGSGGYRVPELYSSVAGLNPMDAPGWHYSNTSPDWGTPGFAYTFPSQYEYQSFNPAGKWLFPGFNMNEGYDPSTSGDAGYGVALYIDDVVECVMDIEYVSETTAIQHMWCRNSIYGGDVMRTNTYGSLTGIKNAPYGSTFIYEFLTHDAAQGYFTYFNNNAPDDGQYKTYTLTVSVPATVPTSAPIEFTPVDSDSTPSPATTDTPSSTDDKSTTTTTSDTDKTTNSGETGPWLIIGQNWQTEFESYVDEIGIVPNGASFYFPLENPTWFAGGMDFLEYIHSNYGGMFAQIALSVKHVGGGGSEGTCNKYYQIFIDVTSGGYDTQLDDLCDNVFSAYPNLQYLLRIEYEVSLYLMAWKSQYGCSSYQWDNTIQYDYMDPSAYKNAFNYIANYIRNKKGLTNVWFVYHPIRSLLDVEGLYPTDEYVDIVGWSFFNNDVCMEVNGITACGTDSVSDTTIEPSMLESINWVKESGGNVLQMVSESSPQYPMANTQELHIEFIKRVYDICIEHNMFAWAYINQNWCDHSWSCPEWTDSRIQISGRESVASYWKETIIPNTQQASNHINLPTISLALEEDDDESFSSKHQTLIIVLVSIISCCFCIVGILLWYIMKEKKNKGQFGFEDDGSNDNNNNNFEEEVENESEDMEDEIEVEVSMEAYPKTPQETTTITTTTTQD